MGSRPILLDIGLVLLVFGSSFGLTQIQHRLVQYPVILDGYPSNKDICIITVISHNTPMGEEVKWLLKEGGGLIFECFDISLKNTPTLHVAHPPLII